MTTRTIALGLLAATLILTGFGCSEANQYVPPPPPEVEVEPAKQNDVTDYVDFTGRTKEVAWAEIRARVKGFLKSVDFKEGQIVKADQPLYEIDPEEFIARMNRAKASVASAAAARDLADATLKRMKQAAETKAVSTVDVLVSQAQYDEALAAVDAAKAALREAEIELGYTKVASPIAGRITRTLVTEGNLVGQADATLLATVRRMHPLHVYFTLGERDLLQFVRQIPEKHRGLTVADIPEAERRKVIIQFSDGTSHPHQGVVDYIDNTVDPKTGTITARAVVPNPDNQMYPGMFVRVRLPRVKKDAITVPEVAVQRDLAGYFVMAVDKENKVERVNVKPGAKIATERVIEEGLDVAARIIVNGLQRARPGIQVTLASKTPEPAEGGGAPEQPAPSPKKTGGE